MTSMCFIDTLEHIELVYKHKDCICSNAERTFYGLNFRRM